MIASISSKLVFLFVRVQQDGIYLDAQTDQHQSGRQTDSSKAVDIWIEDFGVIAATTAHQNKAQGNKSYANEKEQIVSLLKHELLGGFLNVLVFLAHAANLVKSFPEYPVGA
jgi:hypothetical protein